MAQLFLLLLLLASLNVSLRLFFFDVYVHNRPRHTHTQKTKRERAGLELINASNEIYLFMRRFFGYECIIPLCVCVCAFEANQKWAIHRHYSSHCHFWVFLFSKWRFGIALLRWLPFSELWTVASIGFSFGFFTLPSNKDSGCKQRFCYSQIVLYITLISDEVFRYDDMLVYAMSIREQSIRYIRRWTNKRLKHHRIRSLLVMCCFGL